MLTSGAAQSGHSKAQRETRAMGQRRNEPILVGREIWCRPTSDALGEVDTKWDSKFLRMRFVPSVKWGHKSRNLREKKVELLILGYSTRTWIYPFN